MSETAHDGVSIETAVEGGEDRIGAPPDELLQYMMSFLLSRDAVRTCVLARRWRTLWKSVPALHVHDPESYDGATGSSKFVDELLCLRDPTPLSVCVIISTCMEMVDDDSDWDEKAYKLMEPWLTYAVSCQVQELEVHFPLWVADMIFISSHLKRLHLSRMRFGGCSLDFSSCQVLEVLKMDLCEIFADISSQSLKYLYINGCSSDWDISTYIFAPNLVGFGLNDHSGLTPFIFSMPSLVTASVIVGLGCADYPDKADGEDYNSIVLEGLSGAMNLELEIYDHSLFVFRNDLKCRPMFSKLKRLSLNDWCVADDFNGLVYFLQHSPILETLTIDLRDCYHQVSILQEEPVFETNESYNPSEQLLVSKHLKVVTIKCQTREDAEVPCILKILSAHGVPSKQIVIQSIDEEN